MKGVGKKKRRTCPGNFEGIDPGGGVKGENEKENKGGWRGFDTVGIGNQAFGKLSDEKKKKKL